MSVSHDLSSDHYTICLDLNPVPVYKELRSLRSIDKTTFRDDLQSLVSSPLFSTADQLDSTLRATLDKHAPVSRRLVRPAKTEPWYPDVCDQLREAKRQRRSSGLTQD